MAPEGSQEWSRRYAFQTSDVGREMMSVKTNHTNSQMSTDKAVLNLTSEKWYPLTLKFYLKNVSKRHFGGLWKVEQTMM